MSRRRGSPAPHIFIESAPWAARVAALNARSCVVRARRWAVSWINVDWMGRMLRGRSSRGGGCGDDHGQEVVSRGRCAGQLAMASIFCAAESLFKLSWGVIHHVRGSQVAFPLHGVRPIEEKSASFRSARTQARGRGVSAQTCLTVTHRAALIVSVHEQHGRLPSLPPRAHSPGAEESRLTERITQSACTRMPGSSPLRCRRSAPAVL